MATDNHYRRGHEPWTEMPALAVFTPDKGPSREDTKSRLRSHNISNSSNNSAGMVARRRLDPTPVVLLKERPEREPPLSASTKAALPRA